MADVVKQEYLVQYRVLPDQPVVNCRIKTTDLKELHRILTEFTLKRIPIKDWDTLIVHVTEYGVTKEYGKTFLGGMYDAYVEFGEEDKVEAGWGGRYLRKAARTINTGISDSIFNADFMSY